MPTEPNPRHKPGRHRQIRRRRDRTAVPVTQPANCQIKWFCLGFRDAGPLPVLRCAAGLPGVLASFPAGTAAILVPHGVFHRRAASSRIEWMFPGQEDQFAQEVGVRASLHRRFELFDAYPPGYLDRFIGLIRARRRRRTRRATVRRQHPARRKLR